jgi:hypothetical protein
VGEAARPPFRAVKKQTWSKIAVNEIDRLGAVCFESLKCLEKASAGVCLKDSSPSFCAIARKQRLLDCSWTILSKNLLFPATNRTVNKPDFLLNYFPSHSRGPSLLPHSISSLFFFPLTAVHRQGQNAFASLACRETSLAHYHLIAFGSRLKSKMAQRGALTRRHHREDDGAAAAAAAEEDDTEK